MNSPIPNWSKAKFKGWIISLLRKGTLRYPPRNEVLKEAKTEKKINPSSGRMAQHYKCAKCRQEFPLSKVYVDHVVPVVDPVIGFIDWNNYIERMFCHKENLQVLCSVCHDAKTAIEKGRRK